ncbi:MAG: hypothetical protein GX117_12375 [Candidatus Hydrogenedentes bacterium]|nr:hypothetical protein [Candidatus Hydrogenedentota bacterium]
MSWKLTLPVLCLALLCACSQPAPVQDAAAPAAAAPEAAEAPSPQGDKADAPAAAAAAAPAVPPEVAAPVPAEPPVDLGDVDSGVFLRATLSPNADSSSCTAEYVETMRGNLSLATIIVKAPFPKELPLHFELTSKRDFPNTPVVVRAHAYREDNESVGDEYACILGTNARGIPDAEGNAGPTYTFTQDILQGLETIPETLLAFAKAEAYLMPPGTVETLLDPRHADSPDQVSLMSNPVRIYFVEE